MALTNARMHEFERDLVQATASSAAAILAYVGSVNPSQADCLVEVAPTSSAVVFGEGAS
jgi:hypothetical protein